MIPLVSTKQHHKQSATTRNEHDPCIVCGKAMRRAVTFLHVVEGGSHIVKRGEPYTNEKADLGLHPIGADCLRRRPELREYVH